MRTTRLLRWASAGIVAFCCAASTSATAGLYRELAVEYRPRLEYGRYRGEFAPLVGRTVLEPTVVTGENVTERNLRRIEDALVDFDRTLLMIDDAVVEPVAEKVSRKLHGHHPGCPHSPYPGKRFNPPYPRSLYGFQKYMGPAKQK